MTSDTTVAPSYDQQAAELAAQDQDRVDFRARLIRYLLDEAREVGEEDDRSVNGILNHALAVYLEQRRADKARLDRPDEPDVVRVTGPYHSNGDYLLEVEGIPVPHVRVHVIQGTPDVEPRYVLMLDDRFQTTELTWGEMWTQAWFWANAMAISAGWTSHGPNARRLAPHGGETVHPLFAKDDRLRCYAFGADGLALLDLDYAGARDLHARLGTALGLSPSSYAVINETRTGPWTVAGGSAPVSRPGETIE